MSTEKAREIVAAALQIPADSVPDDASIDNFDAWDSLGHLRIVLKLEEVIGRELKAEETASIVAIEDISKIVEAQVGA